MAQKATQVYYRLSGIKAWVALAGLFSIALFGYYLFQGVRYWQASSEVSEIREDIRSLERKINSRPQIDEAQPSSSLGLERQLSDLEDLESLFNYPGTDDLLAIVSRLAAESGLKLSSMRAETSREEVLVILGNGDQLATDFSKSSGFSKAHEEETGSDVPKGETADVLAYHVRPVTIAMEGPSANLAQFLISLQQRVPVVSAPSIRISELDQVPTSKIQLLFYLSTHEIPEEENASVSSGDGGSG